MGWVLRCVVCDLGCVLRVVSNVNRTTYGYRIHCTRNTLLASFAQLLAGKGDKDIFQRWLGNLHVPNLASFGANGVDH